MSKPNYVVLKIEKGYELVNGKFVENGCYAGRDEDNMFIIYDNISGKLYVDDDDYKTKGFKTFVAAKKYINKEIKMKLAAEMI